MSNQALTKNNQDSNQGELISRDVLNDILELYERHHPRLATNVYEFGVALRELINNTPTVPLPDFKEGYKQAILDGKTNFSRPQEGEWIAREDMDYLDENKVIHKHFKCNKCGFIYDFIDGHTSQYNFCPNCGAKMQKGEEE